jgi:hypothetical protein
MILVAMLTLLVVSHALRLVVLLAVSAPSLRLALVRREVTMSTSSQMTMSAPMMMMSS